MLKRVRASAEDRKEEFLDIALGLAEEKGYNRISSPDLAAAAQCGHSLIFHHFVNMDRLRSELMKWAIQKQNLKVLGQGLMAKDSVALSAPAALKQKALKAITQI